MTFTNAIGGNPVMVASFGKGPPYSLGIEEEYQLLHPGTYGLVSRIEALLSIEGEVVEPRTPELLQSVVKVPTGVAARVSEAVEGVADLRERLRRMASDEDAFIASAGTHPFFQYNDHDPTERWHYAELAAQLGWVAARQLVFGLHLHVGVSSAERAIACANGMRRYLPELIALSANSPFWQGRDTGLASARVKILDGLPRTGLPPAHESWAGFEALVAEGVRTGCFPDFTHICWDVRPHPAYGTVEIRVCDAQTCLENIAALAALVQSLVAVLGSAFECGDVIATVPDVVLEENRWRAARDGLRARLIDLDGDCERTATEAINVLLERCEPAAAALGCERELGLVDLILTRGTGADDQRRVYQEHEDLFAVGRQLVWETVTPAIV
jgi:glutamate---cysteine ligase / carboxylate-amine ligase